MPLIETLPENWETHRASDEESTWRYHHRYLDVEIAVTGEEGGYGITVRRASAAAGIVEDDFAPGGPITDRADARDWSLALLRQIDRQFAPAATDYAARAMRAIEGDPVDGDPGPVDVTTCPVCDAPLFQYRGTNVSEQIRTHLEFMDDDSHAELAASLEERLSSDAEEQSPGSAGPRPGAGPEIDPDLNLGSGPRSGSGVTSGVGPGQGGLDRLDRSDGTEDPDGGEE